MRKWRIVVAAIGVAGALYWNSRSRSKHVHAGASVPSPAITSTAGAADAKGGVDPEVGRRIRESMEAFEKRTRYRTLTVEVLSKIPDDDLEQAIIDFIYDCKLPKSGAGEREAFNRLSPGFKAIFTTRDVEAEVDNGGFNQYFWNSAGAYASDAVAGFDLIGAPAIARLVERAIAIHAEDAPKTKRFKDRGDLQAFSESYEDNRLNALDHRFYELDDDLPGMRMRFIRAHPELFVGKC